MNKKISTSFAILVILLVASFATFVFREGSRNLNSGSSFPKVKNRDEAEKCSRRAYDGEVKIRVWNTNENGENLLQVAEDDLEKLPVQDEKKSKVKLVDGSSVVLEKIEKASEEKPAEVTVKGFYLDCEGVPMISLNSGEEVFKKYLN